MSYNKPKEFNVKFIILITVFVAFIVLAFLCWLLYRKYVKQTSDIKIEGGNSDYRNFAFVKQTTGNLHQCILLRDAGFRFGTENYFLFVLNETGIAKLKEFMGISNFFSYSYIKNNLRESCVRDIIANPIKKYDEGLTRTTILRGYAPNDEPFVFSDSLNNLTNINGRNIKNDILTDYVSLINNVVLNWGRYFDIVSCVGQLGKYPLLTEGGFEPFNGEYSQSLSGVVTLPLNEIIFSYINDSEKIRSWYKNDKVEEIITNFYFNELNGRIVDKENKDGGLAYLQAVNNELDSVEYYINNFISNNGAFFAQPYFAKVINDKKKKQKKKRAKKKVIEGEEEEEQGEEIITISSLGDAISFKEALENCFDLCSSDVHGKNEKDERAKNCYFGPIANCINEDLTLKEGEDLEGEVQKLGEFTIGRKKYTKRAINVKLVKEIYDTGARFLETINERAEILESCARLRAEFGENLGNKIGEIQGIIQNGAALQGLTENGDYVGSASKVNSEAKYKKFEVADVFPAYKLALTVMFLIIIYPNFGDGNVEGYHRMLASYVLYVNLFNTYCNVRMDKSWNDNIKNEFVYEKINVHEEIINLGEMNLNIANLEALEKNTMLEHIKEIAERFCNPGFVVDCSHGLDFEANVFIKDRLTSLGEYFNDEIDWGVCEDTHSQKIEGEITKFAVKQGVGEKVSSYLTQSFNGGYADRIAGRICETATPLFKEINEKIAGKFVDKLVEVVDDYESEIGNLRDFCTAVENYVFSTEPNGYQQQIIALVEEKLAANFFIRVVAEENEEEHQNAEQQPADEQQPTYPDFGENDVLREVDEGETPGPGSGENDNQEEENVEGGPSILDDIKKFISDESKSIVSGSIDTQPVLLEGLSTSILSEITGEVLGIEQNTPESSYLDKVKENLAPILSSRLKTSVYSYINTILEQENPQVFREYLDSQLKEVLDEAVYISKYYQCALSYIKIRHVMSLEQEKLIQTFTQLSNKGKTGNDPWEVRKKEIRLTFANFHTLKSEDKLSRLENLAEMSRERNEWKKTGIVSTRPKTFLVNLRALSEVVGIPKQSLKTTFHTLGNSLLSPVPEYIPFPEPLPKLDLRFWVAFGPNAELSEPKTYEDSGQKEEIGTKISEEVENLENILVGILEGKGNNLPPDDVKKMKMQLSVLVRDIIDWNTNGLISISSEGVAFMAKLTEQLLTGNLLFDDRNQSYIKKKLKNDIKYIGAQ